MTTISHVGRVTVQNLWPDCDALNFIIGDISISVSKEGGAVHVYVQDDLEVERLIYVLGDNEVLDPDTGEYGIHSDEYPFFEGATVVALCTVTDSGYAPGDKRAPVGDTVAANEGDLGTIVLIDAGNHCLPTVRFHKTGHSTIVTEDEIKLYED